MAEGTVFAGFHGGRRKRLAMQLLGIEREEIAEALGVSDRGLRKVIGKGRQELRSRLER